jgi:hypothetical protein
MVATKIFYREQVLQEPTAAQFEANRSQILIAVVGAIAGWGHRIQISRADFSL